MCYDDMIRVADLKTRSTRGARVRREVGVQGDAILQTTEYFHPRIEEFCGTMPAAPRPLHRGAPEARRLHRPPHQSRPPHPHRQFSGFATLWLVGGMRRWRRACCAIEVEQAHLERWYELALDHCRRRTTRWPSRS